jgi:hypothetical protein
MSYTFPLSVAEFADTLGVAQLKWTNQNTRELSGLGSGQILEADLAPQLRTADLTLRERHHEDAQAIEAKLNAIIRSMGTFYLYDPRRPAPKADPDGAILGAATVTIHSLPDAKSISLEGLPASYVLSAGDPIAFDYGSPARRWFGEVAEGVTADSEGTTAAFEVSPFLPAAASTGTTVALVKAAFKAKIVPGSLNVQAQGLTSAISFSVVQKP